MPLFRTLALAVLLGSGAAPALAHSVLERSVPAAGAAVAQAPSSIELTFNETIGANFATLDLTGPEGAGVELGAASVSADGRTLAAPVEGSLPAGAYEVEWGVLSQDGHRVTGDFRFTVE